MTNKDPGRHWYYVVGIEIEMIVQADYPATAYDSIHDVVHQLLDPIDKNRFPRVCCNLVGNMTPWPEALSMCAIHKPAPPKIKPRREITFATSKTTLKRGKTVLP